MTIGEDLLKTNTKIFIATTGAGAGIQQRIWETPGISKSFVGSCFPYSEGELEYFVGHQIDKYCSEATAIEMAMTAFMRAYSEGQESTIGLGISASVATKEEHRGDHRIHAAICSDEGLFVVNRNLKKGKGIDYRFADGIEADTVGLSMIQQILGLKLKTFNQKIPLLPPTKEELDKALYDFPIWPQLIETPWKKNRLGSVPDDFVLYPGAFNPFHEGHKYIAERVFEKSNYRGVGGNILFELSRSTPHKKLVSVPNLLKRTWCLQFFGPVLWSKEAKLYHNKFDSELTKHMELVMGVDSFLRMMDPKWLGSESDVKTIQEMVRKLQNNCSHIYVADRMVDGKLLNVYDVPERHEFRKGFISRIDVPETLAGMSSTEIRKSK